MKKIVLILFSSILILGCSEDDLKISEFGGGIYQGYFEYNNGKYYSAIAFSDNNFEELPSGGVMQQKDFFYYTKGHFSITNKSIHFNVTSKYEGAIPAIYLIIKDWYLEGDFKVNFISRDSLSFERGTGNRKIIYSLRKMSE